MKSNKFILAILLFILAAVPIGAVAANLGFSPSTLTRTVGGTFSVSVYVSSPDKAMNAASGVVSFPIDKLEVVSVSKMNSVMNLWVQEPTFSNTKGTINFEGIALNPGYTGSRGTVIAVTFRTKSAGVANITFSSGSVLANDGVGTNILEDLGSASFSIQKIQVPEDISIDTQKPDTENPQINESALPETPVTTFYPEEIKSGGILKIHGIANSGVDVEIRILGSDGSIQEKVFRSTGAGGFVAIFDSLSQPGIYTFTAQAIDEAGNISEKSNPLSFIVKPKLLNQLIESILSYLSMTLLIVLLVVGLITSVIFVWFKLIRIIRRLRRESREAEKVVEKSFNLLRRDLQEHITRLKAAKEKRKLSSEELAFLERFEEELSEAKDIIAKEVQDISHS
jgi:hypothetical protein